MTVFPRPLAFVDLETTGADPARDRITEIGIVEVSGDDVREWSSLVNPQTPIPPFIERLTGISDAMVADAPSFSELAAELRVRLEGRVFLAHNARFDYGFLRHEFRRVGVDFRADVLCTVKLSRKLFPQHHKHSLDALVERHGLPVESRHRALSDARAIHGFWHKVHLELPAESVRSVLDDLLRTPHLPPGVDPSVLDDLPEGPGVYLFFAGDGTPLHVDRCDNIRRRVLAHFTSARSSERAARIARDVGRIDWIETAGELGASLTQSRLARELAPIHDARPRRKREPCSWKLEKGPDGGLALSLTHPAAADFATGGELYGLFPSAERARESLREIAAAHRLCLCRLGLEPGAGPCSAHSLKRCDGVCAGREALGRHDIRLFSALAKIKLPTWPFPGPVGIVEANSWSGRREIHLVDHWCHLGTVQSEGDIGQTLSVRPTFDLDTYRILVRHLKQAKGEIIPLARPVSGIGEF